MSPEMERTPLYRSPYEVSSFSAYRITSPKGDIVAYVPYDPNDPDCIPRVHRMAAADDMLAALKSVDHPTPLMQRAIAKAEGRPAFKHAVVVHYPRTSDWVELGSYDSPTMASAQLEAAQRLFPELTMKIVQIRL